MAIAFRSGANTAYGSRTNITVTAPAGIVNGDILVALIATGTTSGPPSPTLAGWTSFGTNLVYGTAGIFQVQLTVLWKRAASESGNYTFTHSAASSAGWIGAFSGCIATGTPLSATSNNSANSGQTSTGTSITTTQANSFLLWLGGDFADTTNNLSPPSGMTERLDAVVIYVADQLIASAGATGNRTMTNNNGPGANSAWGVRLVELLAATGGGTTDGVGAGSVTLSGTAGGAQTAGAAGAGTVAFAGTAGGAQTAAAVGAGSISFSGTAVGAQVDGAAGAGSITFSGAAGGAQIDGAAGAGTITFAGVGVGSSSSSGTTDGVGAGTITFSGAAGGAQIDGAAGGAAITFAGLGGGAEIAQAAGSGTITFGGAGSSDNGGDVGTTRPRGGGRSGLQRWEPSDVLHPEWEKKFQRDQDDEDARFLLLMAA